jgi:hypothetical protein
MLRLLLRVGRQRWWPNRQTGGALTVVVIAAPAGPAPRKLQAVLVAQAALAMKAAEMDRPAATER